MQHGKKLRASILPIAMGLLMLVLAACGGGGTANTGQKAPANKQVLTQPLGGLPDIATFDPALVTDLYSAQSVEKVFTGLVAIDEQGNVKGQLAQSWDISPDGLTYTFHLKPNLKFSDGTPLTSQDVVYSIDRALQPELKSQAASLYLAQIKDALNLSAGKIKTIIGDSLKAPDPNTVQITITQKSGYFLEALTNTPSYVVEKKLIDKYGNKNWTDHLNENMGGAGPFKVQSYEHSKQIVFVPNPNYYGPKPQLQKVTVVFYKQTDTAYQAYRVGQVDEASVPSQYMDQVKNSSEFHQSPTLSINYYTMNYLVKPFDSINMRKAFALAINKDEINQAVWKGQYIPTNHIIPEGMPGYNPDLKGPDGTSSTKGNKAMAQQFLQAGLKDEGVTSVAQLPPIKVTYPSGSTQSDNEVAALIQMWKNVLGINVKADPVDFNKLIDETTAATNNPNGLQMWGIGWIADYPDPQDWITLQFDKGSAQNNMNYGQNHSADAAQQQALQKQMEQADAMDPGQARLKLYQQIEQQLVNDVAWLPTQQQQSNYVVKPYVQGYKGFPQGIIPADYWTNIYITNH